MVPKYAKYAVIVKTDSYAGNFERELCAYLTGHVGECGVGGEYVDDELARLFDGYIIDEADDSGCFRPVDCGGSIEGTTNTDVVIFFENKPTDSLIDTLKSKLPEASLEFNFKNLGLELLEFVKTTNKLTL